MNDLSVSVSIRRADPFPRWHCPRPPAKVTARDLNFYYGESHALKNINLTLGTNRVTAFIGPSGCGKSTLAADLQPDVRPLSGPARRPAS